MQVTHIADAITSLEKANAELEPELLNAAGARKMLELYARAKKLASFGETVIARKVDDAAALARATGTSVGKARQTVETAKALQGAQLVSEAFAGGDISLDQATEIARAEKAQPGSATELLSVANEESFQVLREKSRKVVLEAEQHRGLGERQREARTARHYTDELGMVKIEATVLPELGAAIVNRAEAEAKRLHRAAKAEGRAEPYDRHLCDAFAKMLAGSEVKGHHQRADVMILVSYEVAERGWTDVRENEVCKIPGLGPVGPQRAKEIAENAFLSGVFFDGKDLRQIKSFTRNWPADVARVLNLGKPPEFDGLKCVDCGNRFHIENDHVEPYLGGDNPSALWNHDHRCWPCHLVKTEADRRAGKLKPPEKRGPPDP